MTFEPVVLVKHLFSLLSTMQYNQIILSLLPGFIPPPPAFLPLSSISEGPHLAFYPHQPFPSCWSPFESYPPETSIPFLNDHQIVIEQRA